MSNTQRLTGETKISFITFKNSWAQFPACSQPTLNHQDATEENCSLLNHTMKLKWTAQYYLECLLYCQNKSLFRCSLPQITMSFLSWKRWKQPGRNSPILPFTKLPSSCFDGRIAPFNQYPADPASFSSRILLPVHSSFTRISLPMHLPLPLPLPVCNIFPASKHVRISNS